MCFTRRERNRHIRQNKGQFAQCLSKPLHHHLISILEADSGVGPSHFTTAIQKKKSTNVSGSMAFGAHMSILITSGPNSKAYTYIGSKVSQKCSVIPRMTHRSEVELSPSQRTADVDVIIKVVSDRLARFDNFGGKDLATMFRKLCSPAKAGKYYA